MNKKFDQETCSIININRSHGYSSHKCSYSGVEDGMTTCGFTAKQMSILDYRLLLDRGFRRCGNYYYQPDLFKCHSKLFTIRGVATEHKMRKSHKKIWNRWQRYLRGERDIKTEPQNQGKVKNEKNRKNAKNGDSEVARKLGLWAFEQLEAIKELLGAPELLKEGAEPGIETKGDLTKTAKFTSRNPSSGVIVYSSDIIKRVYGQNLKKMKHKLKDFLKLENGGEALKTLIGASEPIEAKEGQLFTASVNKKGLIELKFQNPNQMIEESPTASQEAQTHQNTQKKQKDTKGKQTNSPKPRKFRIEITEADSTPENFALYQRYTAEVHGDEKDSESSYKDFLCTKNLVKSQKVSKSDPTQILKQGCFHMNHYIDDKLVCVGVIDLLDNGLSTVYCFYDPDLVPLKYGVISALIEIDWIKQKAQFFPEFKYYYLGYYIHDCQKMSYKADFEPIELLCPKSRRYVRIDGELKRKIIEEGKVQLVDGFDETVDHEGEFCVDERKRMMGVLVSSTLELRGEAVSFMRLRKEFFMQIYGIFEELFVAMGPEVLGNVLLTL